MEKIYRKLTLRNYPAAKTKRFEANKFNLDGINIHG